MKSKLYNVTEIFTSIQGEGPQVGIPAVFVRFSGCQLDCEFCDEAHREGNPYTAEQIRKQIFEQIMLSMPNVGPNMLPLVVLTGGEPTLQVDHALLDELRSFSLAIETNGDMSAFDTPEEEATVCSVLRRIGIVVVSPKTSMVSDKVIQSATHVKMLVPYLDTFCRGNIADMSLILGTSRREDKWAREQYEIYLQPITPRDWMDDLEFKRNSSIATSECMKLLALRIHTRVVPQTHVFMGLR